MLIQRLNTDRSIAPLVAQFVPLKVDTGTPEWSQWVGKYRHEGNGIPILYVIRADGEMLYGKTGSLPGEQLTQFLRQHMATAGKVCTPAQAKKLATAVSSANQALARDDPATAIQALLALKKLGTLGQLGSYATPALEADQLIQQLTDSAREQLAATVTSLEGSAPPFPILLQFVETCRTYALLPTVKADIKLAQRKLQRTPRMRDLLRDAEALDRARILAASPRNSKRARAALAKLVERGAESPVAALAAADLQDLDQDTTSAHKPKVAATANVAAKLRTWTDVTGTYTVRAVLVEVQDGQAVLRRADGKTVNVPIEKLSDSDRRVIGHEKT